MEEMGFEPMHHRIKIYSLTNLATPPKSSLSLITTTILDATGLEPATLTCKASVFPINTTHPLGPNPKHSHSWGFEPQFLL